MRALRRERCCSFAELLLPLHQQAQQLSLGNEGDPSTHFVAQMAQFENKEKWNVEDLEKIVEACTCAEKAGDQMGLQVGLFQLFHKLGNLIVLSDFCQQISVCCQEATSE